MAKKRFSTLFVSLLAVGLSLFAGMRVYYRATDDFRLSNISYPMPPRAEWDIPSLSSEEQRQLDAILDQKFTYIGKGAQSYAFVSDDGRYVLKFFKFKHLKPSWFVDHLPNLWPLKDYREKEQYKKNRKLLSVFNGYRLSYGLHKEEAGLIYVHLNRSDNIKRSVNVVDKIGLARQINLDEVNFVIQEKAETSRKVICNQLAQGDPKRASEYIRKLFDLYRSEYAKGIYDHDHGILHNTGFVGERPIHLDVGKMYRDENIQKTENSLQDLAIVAKKISVKVREDFPAYYEEISSDIEDYMTSAFGQPFRLQ